MQSPDPPLFGCLNKVGFLSLAGVMLSLSLKRYYEPLRLPIRSNGLSDQPYIHQLTALCRHRIGSPALYCYSSDTCHPCYPERSTKMIPLSYLSNSGLPHMTIGSASLNSDEATHRFIFITACTFAHRKLTTPGYPDAASWC